MYLLDAMNAACEDITADHCRGWVRHSRRFFSPVQKNLWPDQQERQDVHQETPRVTYVTMVPRGMRLCALGMSMCSHALKRV